VATFLLDELERNRDGRQAVFIGHPPDGPILSALPLEAAGGQRERDG
jgi:hypothetical protein